MNSRPMSLRKETWRDRRWRPTQTGPHGWLWRCHICNLEATHPAGTLADGYAQAVEHLDVEHLTTAA